MSFRASLNMRTSNRKRGYISPSKTPFRVSGQACLPSLTQNAWGFRINSVRITLSIAALLLIFPLSSWAQAKSEIRLDTKNIIKSVKLNNGMRVIVMPEPDSPLVAFAIFVNAGSEQETLRTAGIGSFVARTLLSSTDSMSQTTINNEIADLGGNVTVTRQPDWTKISALTVPDRFDESVDLLTDVLKNATFDPDEVESQRYQILDDIDNGEANIFDKTYNNLRASLFGGTGYALNALGTPRSIKTMPREQLLRYYRQYFIPSNIVFVVTGNVTPEAAVNKITKDMEDYDPLLRGSRRRPAPPVVLPELTQDLTPVKSYEVDLSEVCVMVGCRAPSMNSDDYPALQVLNALLGGMKTSRMFTTLREKQGLSYELGSFYSPQYYSGDISAFVFASSKYTDPVTKKPAPVVPVIKKQILQMLDEMKNRPPSQLELTRAKRYLIGSYKIKHERIEDRASLLGIAELTSIYGADMDLNYAYYINEVTGDDVVRVARKYLIHPAVSSVEPDPHNGITLSE